jgi:DNA polymerase I-like protein with 3'-5' exonuclease and polymerase domains
MSYDEIIETQGTDDDLYSKAKRAVFAMLYGGVGHTLKERLGVDLEVAEAAYEKFVTMYSKVGEERRKVFNMFCSMRQPGGLGSNVEWHEPSEYIESIYGFRRYFTLENQICKALFDLATDPPKEWRNVKIKVRRRDREQTASGATQSALYGAAFAIQAQSMRSACNHVIQSSGANLTKNLQNEIWQLQPQGVHEFKLMVLNCHDEIMVPAKNEYHIIVSNLVKDFIKRHSDKVPLLKIDWKDRIDSWAGKH